MDVAVSCVVAQGRQWNPEEAIKQVANNQSNFDKTWSTREAYLLALVCLFMGLIVGYVFRGSPAQGPAVATPAVAAAPQQMPASPESLNVVAAPLLDALKANPKDAETLAKLGNLYFDHQFYSESVKYYQQALELRPNDADVRTDMGTAYFYMGFADRAVAEFEKSLQADPKHLNSLFNLGIVRSQGLKDYAGAVQAWERLLQVSPDHPQKEKIRQLIAEAKSQKG